MNNEVRRWTVSGVVQGVGFRMCVVREARALGLGGTVRNRSDGAVEVVAEGPGETLDYLEAQLHTGPEMAEVQNVQRETVEGNPGEFNGRFTVIG